MEIGMRAKFNLVLIIFSLGGIGVLSYVFYANTYTLFSPLLFDGYSFKYVSRKGDDEFRQNLRQVLDYYKVAFTVDDNNEILVKRKLCWDEALLLNYTSKASNKDWLNTHKMDE